MNITLPPVPRDDNVEARTDWFNRMRDALSRLGTSLTWSVLDKTGSKLTDIETRNHSDLQNIQGNTFHITSSQASSLSSGLSVTITTAKLTTLGTDGSMTFTNGILTGQIAAT